MTAAETADVEVIPDDIARQVVLPEGHGDEDALFDAYKWLRENNPLGKAIVQDYAPMWLVSKHADIMEVEREPDIFTSGGGEVRGGANPILTTIAGEEFTKSINNGSFRIIDVLQYIDPPEHSVVKRIASDQFRPRAVKPWTDSIRELAKDAVDKLAQTDGRVDFARDFAVYFPLHVVMGLFGVPPEDEPRMMMLTQELFGVSESEPDDSAPAEEPDPAAMARQFAAAIGDFSNYFANLAEDRRQNPRDDMSTVIATAKQEDGSYYPHDYVFGWFVSIATAGHDTTSSTMSGAALELARNPELLSQLREDSDRIPDLVNEALRWASPVKHFMRTATQDYTLRGRKIKAGDRLMLLYQSGNRDAEVFDEPDKFNIDRKPNNHIAFGYGPHMCVGQHLAKLELRLIFEELLKQVESIKLRGDPAIIPTNFVGGLRKLPVEIEFVKEAGP